MKWRGLGFAQVPFSNGLLRSRNSAYNLAFIPSLLDSAPHLFDPVSTGNPIQRFSPM
jgi:hypothetical protein